MKLTFKIDGRDVEVVAGSAEHLAIQKRLDDAAALLAAVEREKARADAAEAKLTQANARLDAIDAKARTDARTALEATARTVLGAEARFDGKSDRDVRVAVIAKVDPTFAEAGRPDAYVEARFDIATATATAPPARTPAPFVAALEGGGAPGATPAPVTPKSDPKAYVAKARADAASLHTRKPSFSL